MQTLILLALLIVIGWVLFRPFNQKELDKYNDKDWPEFSLPPIDVPNVMLLVS